jgi:serine phosphatase RsbU (regulator of sigma subunit)
VTALARHTLRTAAMLGLTPTGMLETLHRALREQPAGSDLCTVCLVTVERLAAHAALTVTLAGHPPPLLIDAAGARTQLGTPGTLLGVLDPIEVTEVAVELCPGQTLLLYTDGLPEAGRPTGPDDQSLFEVGDGVGRSSLGELLEVLEEGAMQRANGSLRDDIALLAIRLGDSGVTPRRASDRVSVHG